MFDIIWNLLKEAFGAVYQWFVTLFDAFDIWPTFLGLVFTICVFRFLILPAFQDGDFSDDDKNGRW